MKIFQLIFKSLLIAFFFFLILFISSGHINYWQGWLYISMNLLMTLITVVQSLGNSELLSERLAPGKGTKKWDKLVLGLSVPVYVAMLIVSGLDSGRFHWSPDFHWSIYLSGIILIKYSPFLDNLTSKIS